MVIKTTEVEEQMATVVEMGEYAVSFIWSCYSCLNNLPLLRVQDMEEASPHLLVTYKNFRLLPLALTQSMLSQYGVKENGRIDLVGRVWQWFVALDTDRSGRITATELGKALYQIFGNSSLIMASR
jgi:hypothetical protein